MFEKCKKNIKFLLTKEVWDDILNFVVEKETRQQNDFEISRKKSKKVVDKAKRT